MLDREEGCLLVLRENSSFGNAVMVGPGGSPPSVHIIPCYKEMWVSGANEFLGPQVTWSLRAQGLISKLKWTGMRENLETG